MLGRREDAEDIGPDMTDKGSAPIDKDNLLNKLFARTAKSSDITFAVPEPATAKK